MRTIVSLNKAYLCKSALVLFGFLISGNAYSDSRQGLNDSGKNNRNPAGIPALLDELAARVAALESGIAINSSVEGRSYCFAVETLSMVGNSASMTGSLVSTVIRGSASFSLGEYLPVTLYSAVNTQNDSGQVFPGVPPFPLTTAFYVQSSNQLQMDFGNGVFPTWYVSKDGSVIHGNLIRLTSPPPPAPPGITVGLTTSWTLIESDTCD